MSDEFHPHIAAYFDELSALFGTSPEAADASSGEALEARYRVLAEVVAPDKSVLEAGCGYGGLGAYLAARVPGVRYRGIDVSARQIEAGRQTNLHLDLQQQDLLAVPDDERYDIVVAQGIFYKLGPGAWAKTQRLIRKMWALADEAVAFTALSSWAPNLDPAEYHIDPVRTLKFCRTLTPHVVLRHDYHPGDVCLYLYRKDGAP